MKSTSSKREAPKNSNKVQKKVIKNKDEPPGKKVGKKKKSKIKDKENQRTREKQTKRKKSNSKNKPARLEQSTKMPSCEKSPKSEVKSSKSNVSPKSTIYSSIVNSSTFISSEGVLESPQKKVSPELSSTLSPLEEKKRNKLEEKKRNKVKLLERLSRFWKSKLIEEKIRKELENGKNIASIVEFINHEICKKHLKEPHKRKTVTSSEEAHARRDIGKEQKTLKHKDHKKTLKHKYHKKTLKHNKEEKETLKHNKEEKETLKHKDHKKILKKFASKSKFKVPTDKSKINDATSNNTHDNCNNDAKEDLKFMSSILKTFNIPRNSCEKGLEKHMLHFLYEHYRTFLNKYMMIANFRNSDFHYFENEDVEKAIEKLNEETESTFPPLIEELLSKTIQENSSVQHAFCRSSESNKADELKVLDSENTVSNKDNTAGEDENNHSVINNSNIQLLIQNYVRRLNENRYFINGITNSQLVQKCQQEQKNINELTEKESSITSDTYPQYFVSNDQHQQNNINELTEKESSITCNTDPQYSMPNHYHEQKAIGLNESSVPVTNKQNLQYSMLSYCYGENGTFKLDANAHPQTNDNHLQNIVPKYGPTEKDTFKLDENAHLQTNDTNPPKIVAQYEDIESGDENVPMDGDPSPKNISFQDNPTERNMSREDENVSVAGDTLPKPFSFQDNLAESNMPREDENVSVAGDALPKPFSFQDNLAESISSSEEENVSVAGDKFLDSLAESNSSSEDENVSEAGDISPKYFSLPSEWKSYENTCYSTKEVISERLDHLRASMFYNIF